jgi:hypothetical protein
MFIKKILFGLFALAFSLNARSQYFYKDIVSNQQLLADMSAYKQNNIKTINIISLENNGMPSEGFFCQKKFNRGYTKSELFTRADMASASMLTSTFNKQGLLVSTHDSSDIAVTTNFYRYDDKNQIISILSSIRSKDDDFVTAILEEHLYKYSVEGIPETMTRVKNRTDSTVILFAIDENNQVAIEKDTKSGTKFYYYYDAKKRLTDIVQENEFKPRLKPDYIFEYNNASGKISAMTTTEEGVNDFFVWKYTYDGDLRIKEKCYNRAKQLLGTIEYQYKK